MSNSNTSTWSKLLISIYHFYKIPDSHTYGCKQKQDNLSADNRNTLLQIANAKHSSKARVSNEMAAPQNGQIPL